MTNYNFSANQLTEGACVFVRGKLAYARLTSLIDGADLVASDQRKIQNGMTPVEKPHTTATITNAEVQCADPSKPTLEEQFVAERCYTSKKHPDSGANYSIDSKGTNLPIIAIPSETVVGTFDQDTSGQELKAGLDVTLVLRVYKPKKYTQRGLALDQVVVHEAPRYYSSVVTRELAARGIVFNTAPRAVQARTAGSAVGVGGHSSTTDDDGLSFPTPQPSAPAVVPAQGSAGQALAAQRTAVGAAPAAAAQAAQPPVESLEQRLARIEDENRKLKSGGSAVGSPVAAGVGPGTEDTRGGQQAGITYPG